jgi:hypothetical protein
LNSAAVGCRWGHRSVSPSEFFAEDDQQIAGPFTTFLEAADAVGLLGVNLATTSIWVKAKYRAEAEGAISLFDDLSKEDALALFSDGSPSGR